MAVGADFKKLAHRRGYIQVDRPVKRGLYLLPVAFDEANADNQRLGNAGKTFGLKMANNALGNVVGRENQGIVHGGFRM